MQQGYPGMQHGHAMPAPQGQQPPRYPGLTGPLVVDTSFGWRLGCGVVLALFFTVPFVASGIYGLFIDDDVVPSLRAFGFAFASMLVFGLVPGVIYWRKVTSVERLDPDRVWRFDGKSFPWSEFRRAERVHRRTKYGKVYLYRLDLEFAGGKAAVYGQLVKNVSEVTALVEAVEAGINPWWPLQQR